GASIGGGRDRGCRTRCRADWDVIGPCRRPDRVGPLVVVLGEGSQPPATAVAYKQAREQVGGCGPLSREQMLSGLQSALDSFPGLVIDDPQVLQHARFPLIPRPPPVNPSSSLRILSPLPTIEVELPDVLGVLQHKIDRVGAPRTSGIVQVEPFRDGLFTEAITEQLEDSFHNGRFNRVKGDAVADREGFTMRISPSRVTD